MSVYEKLKELGLALPPATAPVAAFVPAVRAGNLIFVSGHIAKKDGKPWTGKVDAEISVEQGKQAARAAAVDLLGTLHAAIGDLNKIRRIVKLSIFVNSTLSFTEPHLVANGASELFEQVYGEPGKHARTALCVAQLPFGACVEIELTAEVV